MKRIAILGGGASALIAALYLTDTQGWQSATRDHRVDRLDLSADRTKVGKPLDAFLAKISAEAAIPFRSRRSGGDTCRGDTADTRGAGGDAVDVRVLAGARAVAALALAVQ